jgi:hypothetical protein
MEEHKEPKKGFFETLRGLFIESRSARLWPYLHIFISNLLMFLTFRHIWLHELYLYLGHMFRFRASIESLLLNF